MFVVSDELALPVHIYNSILQLIQIGSLYKRIQKYQMLISIFFEEELICRLMDQTKSQEHGIVRNSVNDNVNAQLYQYYRFVISLEESLNQTVNGTTTNSLTLQKL